MKINTQGAGWAKAALDSPAPKQLHPCWEQNFYPLRDENSVGWVTNWAITTLCSSEHLGFGFKKNNVIFTFIWPPKTLTPILSLTGCLSVLNIQSFFAERFSKSNPTLLPDCQTQPGFCVFPLESYWTHMHLADCFVSPLTQKLLNLKNKSNFLYSLLVIVFQNFVSFHENIQNKWLYIWDPWRQPHSIRTGGDSVNSELLLFLDFESQRLVRDKDKTG